MTLDKQAKGRRTAVESKSNRSIYNFLGYLCEATYFDVRHLYCTYLIVQNKVRTMRGYNYDSTSIRL